MDSPFILAVAWLLVAWCVAAVGYVLSYAIRSWLRRRDSWDRALRRLTAQQGRRTRNRWLDALAVAAGYCNARSNKSGTADDRFGYPHWRCALRLGHRGLHRYRQYTWDADGRVAFIPVQRPPAQPWERDGMPTARQVLRDPELRQRWAEKRDALMREVRRNDES